MGEFRELLDKADSTTYESMLDKSTLLQAHVGGGEDDVVVEAPWKNCVGTALPKKDTTVH